MPKDMLLDEFAAVEEILKESKNHKEAKAWRRKVLAELKELGVGAVEAKRLTR